MRVLRARLLERELAEQAAKVASERKAQVGSGERSEKVRTYNFPQGRVTDHRIKHTSHNLDGVLGGDARRVHRRARGGGEAAEAGGRPRSDEPGDRQRRRRAGRRRRRAARRPGWRARGWTPNCCSPRRPGWSGSALVAEPAGRVPPPAARSFGEMVRRRLRREPVAYILGRKGFRHIELAVDGRVLVPRPETELLVELALEVEPAPPARRRHRLGRDRPRRRRRAARLRGDRDRHLGGGARRRPRQRRAPRARRSGPLPRGHGPRRAGEEFDLVLANLPYVAERDWAGLAARGHQMGAARGAARRPRRPRRLSAPSRPPGESHFVPIAGKTRLGAGCRARGRGGQAAAVGDLLREAGFAGIEARRDLAGIERVVVGR